LAIKRGIVELDGLRDKEDVKILILFVCQNSEVYLTRDNLTDIVRYYGLANYFDFATSVEEMVISRHIDCVALETGEYYLMTPLGERTLKELASRLPASVQRKALGALLKVTARIKRNNNISAKYQKTDSGFLVSLGIKDGDFDIFSSEIYVVSELCARQIINDFKIDAEIMYGKIMNVLTGDTFGEIKISQPEKTMDDETY